MNPEDAPVIALRFLDDWRRRGTLGRDLTALIHVVARARTPWDAAADLLSLAGVDERRQEAFYREVYGYEQPGWSEVKPGHPPAPFRREP